MNRFIKYVFIILSVILIVLIGTFAYSMITRGNVPVYEHGSVWYNEETGITLTADDNGVLNGKNVISGMHRGIEPIRIGTEILGYFARFCS